MPSLPSQRFIKLKKATLRELILTNHPRGCFCLLYPASFIWKEHKK